VTLRRRFFNTAGPCKADLHYMLPPLGRLPEVYDLIDRQGYFVIHAPRQTGKQNFTAEEVTTLYQQHTTETGQPFTPEADALAFDLTQGQPWLVNALAAVVTDELLRPNSLNFSFFYN